MTESWSKLESQRLVGEVISMSERLLKLLVRPGVDMRRARLPSGLAPRW